MAGFVSSNVPAAVRSSTRPHETRLIPVHPQRCWQPWSPDWSWSRWLSRTRWPWPGFQPIVSATYAVFSSPIFPPSVQRSRDARWIPRQRPTTSALSGLTSHGHAQPGSRQRHSRNPEYEPVAYGRRHARNARTTQWILYGTPTCKEPPSAVFFFP